MVLCCIIPTLRRRITPILYDDLYAELNEESFRLQFPNMSNEHIHKLIRDNKDILDLLDKSNKVRTANRLKIKNKPR